jgi:hypothetical protein
MPTDDGDSSMDCARVRSLAARERIGESRGTMSNARQHMCCFGRTGFTPPSDASPVQRFSFVGRENGNGIDFAPVAQDVGCSNRRCGYASGATQTPDSPSSRITDDQLRTWELEYGSVKAATEAHPEIEYELRLRAQALEEDRKKAL